MTAFTSKVQHKTYEKGEFSDEKIRNADQTIQLIKDFPFDNERSLTSIELTGPSVTIRNEDTMEYLKMGLYFNGKYCLYYLDSGNHLYEYHAPDMDDACNVVTAFFNNGLDLQKFEKHLFNVGNLAHFITGQFTYRIKLPRVLMLTAYPLVFFLIFLAIGLGSVHVNNDNGYMHIFTLFFVIMLGFVLGRVYYACFVYRNASLYISQGHDIFSFGMDENHVQMYNKNDLQQVIVYESKGTRNPNLIVVFQLDFKDGSSIKLPNLLMSSSHLQKMFAEKLIVQSKKSPFWQL